jgi:hypothetical protein
MLMGVTSWELGALRVPLIMVPDTYKQQSTLNQIPRALATWRHGGGEHADDAIEPELEPGLTSVSVPARSTNVATAGEVVLGQRRA